MRIGVAGLGRIGGFHARTLADVEGVAEVVVTDLEEGRAASVADEVGCGVAGSFSELLTRVDGVVITTPTSTHAELVRAAVAAGVPTFCEKPAADTLAETIALSGLAAASDVPVQIGFQRRFDVGYLRAREAVAAGELGFLHSLRATTHDQSPPHPSYLPTSGGIFRDCNIHDYDIIRFVTGQEVVSVFATGANQGASFFRDAGDVDTGASLLTLFDGTLAAVSATRYNGAGHDVRLELLGSEAALGVGYDDSLAITSAEPGVDYPRGPRARRSSSGSRPRTGRSSRRSSTSSPGGRRRRARSRRRWPPSASPRRASGATSGECPWHSRALRTCDLPGPAAAPVRRLRRSGRGRRAAADRRSRL